jgi:hypothetical protein
MLLGQQVKESVRSMGTPPKKPWAGHTRPEATRAPAAPAAARRPKSPETLSPYVQGDPIPKPEAVEMNTDTTWAEWADLAAAENRKFADTAPLTRTPDERSYAPTLPAPLQALQAMPAVPPVRELTVVEVMVEARLHNRVCPQPAKWQQLYEILPDKKQSGAGWEPAPPLVEAAWKNTPSIPKRMVFREHIEWAASHGCLQQIFTFMKSLPESDWHHMGD